MNVEETQLTAGQVGELLSGLFRILCLYNRNTVLHCPGVGNELTKPCCLMIPSESSAIPKGHTGTVYLQYDGSSNMWAMWEMFTIGSQTLPGRMPVQTRDFFQAMSMVGHLTGISGRLDPRDL
jgi:hypothetical protein